MRIPSVKFFVVAIAFAALAAGCATNPVTGKREFSLVSADQELQMGQEGHKAVLQEYGVYEDPRMQALLDSVGQALAKQSHLPQLEWHFTLLDDPTVNAFAMPGGYIYVTRGIMAHLSSEAQLAGVLGHEIGHVTARHSAQRMTQQQIAGLGVGVASIFSQTFRRYSESAQQALGLMFLKYGRDDENQSDELGVTYALKAGYDPRVIPGTYTMLGRVSARAGARLPSYMSSHPEPADREARTKTLAAQAAAGKTGLLVRERSYLQLIDGVVYGPDPRQGYFTDGNLFIHPNLGFEIQFPAGWKTQNLKTAVVAVEPEQKAGMQLTLANAGDLAPAAFVSQLVQSGKLADARGQSVTIGGSPAWLGDIAVAGDPSSGAAPTTMAAALIRRSPQHMFQIVGRSAQPGDENHSRILAAAKTLRATDEAKRKAEPDRLKIVTVAQAGSFEEVAARQAKHALSLDDLIVLNNMDAGENILKGQLVKTVIPGKR